MLNLLQRSMAYLSLAVVCTVPMLVAVRLWAQEPPPVTAPATLESAQHHFRVSYQSGPVAINRMHSWDLHLEDAGGKGLAGAAIEVGGGMPAHNHGLPTRPQVVEIPGAGNYRIDGLRFHMPGHWEIRLTISADDVSDEVVIILNL